MMVSCCCSLSKVLMCVAISSSWSGGTESVEASQSRHCLVRGMDLVWVRLDSSVRRGWICDWSTVLKGLDIVLWGLCGAWFCVKQTGLGNVVIRGSWSEYPLPGHVVTELVVGMFLIKTWSTRLE